MPSSALFSPRAPSRTATAAPKAPSAEELLSLWVERCIASPTTTTVDSEVLPLLGIDAGRVSAEKAYSTAKKLVRKVGVVLSQDPARLVFTTLSLDLAAAAMRFGPPELSAAIFGLVKRVSPRHAPPSSARTAIAEPRQIGVLPALAEEEDEFLALLAADVATAHRH